MYAPSRPVQFVLKSMSPAIATPVSEYSANVDMSIHAVIKPLTAE